MLTIIAVIAAMLLVLYHGKRACRDRCMSLASWDIFICGISKPTSMTPRAIISHLMSSSTARDVGEHSHYDSHLGVSCEERKLREAASSC
eukprot:4303320-Pyramimonas_sp.AAC.1